MQVIEVSSLDAGVPETVFATPTFMLDDRLMQLGNPGPDDIIFAEAVEDCLLCVMSRHDVNRALYAFVCVQL